MYNRLSAALTHRALNVSIISIQYKTPRPTIHAPETNPAASKIIDNRQVASQFQPQTQGAENERLAGRYRRRRPFIDPSGPATTRRRGHPCGLCMIEFNNRPEHPALLTGHERLTAMGGKSRLCSVAPQDEREEWK